MEFNSKFRKLILAVSGEMGTALDPAFGFFVTWFEAFAEELKGTAFTFKAEVILDI